MRKVAYKAFNSNTVLISFIGSGDSLWKATNRRDFVFHFFTFRQLYIEQIYAFIYADDTTLIAESEEELKSLLMTRD